MGAETIPKSLEEIIKDMEKEARTTSIGIALLGSTGPGLETRRAMRRSILSINPATTVFIPDDDLPREVNYPEMGLNPVMAEIRILGSDKIDLIFVSPSSMGSVTEFGQLSQIPEVAPKLRLLVDHNYHPLFAKAPLSYVSSAELAFMVKYGHVYAVKGTNEIFPEAEYAVLIVTGMTRQLKYFETAKKI